MSWVYRQRSGTLEGPDGRVYTGPNIYSGKPPYKNDPTAERRQDEGPIPRGSYRINLTPRNSARTGSYILELDPIGHNAHGRTDLQFHGDSSKRPGRASKGCIVAPRWVREIIVRSGDDRLEVRE